MPADFLTVNGTAAQRLAERSSYPMIVRYTERVAANARLFAPGTMKQKIRPVVLPGAAPVGLVISDHPATSFVINGTKPHPIFPKKPGGVLVFTPRGSGTKIFVRAVHHPGTKPNNFLLKALRSV